MTGKATSTGNEDMARIALAAQEQAKRVVDKLPLLGPISWLMLQQSATRYAFISDLEWRVLPALVMDQAKLILKDNLPLAFVSWARLSEQAAARYRQPPYHLSPADWRSGDQIWLIDILAPFGNAAEVLEDIRKNVFPGQSLRQLAPDTGNRVQTIEWPAVQAG